MEIRPTYLVMVTADNNNKYYNCFPSGSSFKVEYGRVDVTKQETSYPISMWDKKISEKLKKGYKDVTDLKQALVEEVSVSHPEKSRKQIEDESVRKIIEHLSSIARDKIQKNYTVKASSVTQEMCDNAQSLIDELSKSQSTSDFNKLLLDLFAVIPRRMNNVRDYLDTDGSKGKEIIIREQDLLDTMRGQIYVPSVTSTAVNEPEYNSEETILDEMGISMVEASEEDIAIIKRAMDAHGSHSSGQFSRAWKVINFETQKRFDKFISDNNIVKTKLLFHGSRSENWFSILKTGLKIRPSNAVYTGSMFGDGLYFAPKCQKSIGYTSLGGSYWAGGKDRVAYMALMEVAYGNPYDVYSFDSKYYSMSYNKLPSGTNCLHAHASDGMLRNDEIVVYRQEQCTVKYLIEIKN